MARLIPSFAEFFSALHGYPPFAWQEKVVEFIVEQGRWPRIIAAPTGAGKSSVIDIHLYLNAIASRTESIIARRLIMTVNRRNLVDDHAEHASRIAERLQNATEESVLGTIRNLLIERSASDNFFPVHTIRGGQDLTTDWRTMPLAVQFIASTPDMWGSRVLFRGYGTARHSRSLEAGLLTKDAVLVTDEAHLNKQLVTLARSIEELDNYSTNPITIPGFQLVETTATPSTQHDPAEIIQVQAEDLAVSETLNRRLTTKKSMELVDETTTRKSESRLAKTFVDELLRQRADFTSVPAPIGCIVNTVSLALEISTQLRKQLKVGPADPAVVQFVGAQRPFDREQIKRDLPDLFTTRPIEAVKFVVATQTLEVGVDIDLAALVSELASGDALAQRAGRVNRVGHREAARVIIICPTYGKTNTGVPYSFEELEASRAWLENLPGGDISPWNVLHNPPPQRPPSRMLWQHLTWNDALYFGRSSDELAAADTSISDHGEDLTLWLRDDFAADSEAGIVVREFLTGDALFDANILSLTPPLSEEIYPSTLTRNRDIAAKLLPRVDQPIAAIRKLHVVRDREVFVISQAMDIRPGDTLVLPASAPTFLSGIPSVAGDSTGSDVFEEVITASSSSHITRRFLIPPTSEVAFEYALQLDAADADKAVGTTLEVLSVNLIQELLGINTFEQFRDLGQWQVQVLVPAGTDRAIFCVVSNVPDTTFDQRQTQAARPVLLSQHQRDVGNRAAFFAKKLNIGEVGRDVATAALYHDEGKRDNRFQRYLRYGRSGTSPLAKSARLFNWKQYVAYGLQGWRHEQLSAAYWMAMTDYHFGIEKHLVAWLIGTSHGRGRATFTTDPALLTPVPDQHPTEVVEAAEELFADGSWDDLYEPLSQRYGPWGLAYLEALVRIADQQVSSEDAQ